MRNKISNCTLHLLYINPWLDLTIYSFAWYFHFKLWLFMFILSGKVLTHIRLRFALCVYNLDNSKK